MSTGSMKIKRTIEMTVAHLEALAVIMSEYYPYADDRDLGVVFEEMIEEYLVRENGRLGRIVDGEYKTINQK